MNAQSSAPLDAADSQKAVENPYAIAMDSLYQNVVRERSLSEEQLKKIRSLAYAMSDQTFFEDAEKYLTLFMPLADRYGTAKDQALLYHCMGYNAKKKGEFTQALAYYKKSISLRKNANDREGMSPTLSNMGHIYYDMGDYSRAIEMYRESLFIKREMKDKQGTARTLSGIGNVLSDQGNYEEALQNYREALIISTNIKDTLQIAASYTQLAGVKFLLKELDSSIYYSEKSLTYAKPIQYSYMIGYAWANMGATYQEKGELLKAKEFLINSLELREQLEMPLEIALSQLELARLYIKLGDVEEVLRLAKKAYQTSEEINFLKGKQLASKYLADAYEMEKEPTKALQHYKDFKTFSDSLSSIEEKKVINNVQTQIKVEKETYDLKLAQTRQSLLYKLILVSLAIILVSIVVWFFYSGKLRDKQNEIKIKQKELEAEKKIVYSTQNERKRISQDMHDDLGTSLSGLKIYTELLATKANEEYKKEHLKLLEMTREITLKVRDIVWTLDSKNDTVENLIWYCHHYAEKLLDHFPVQLHVTIQEDIPSLKINGNTRKQLFLSVKEAFNNILKHSEAESVHLSFSYTNEVFTIQIKDNGKGFNKEQPTFGNGILNMKNRMEALEGTFQIISDHKGTTVAFSLHLPQMGN